MRSTHTLAGMELPADVVELIRNKLAEAGYTHAIDKTPDGWFLDMTGIAVVSPSEEANAQTPRPSWLIPGWMALTSHGSKCPEYVDARQVRSVSGFKGGPAIVQLGGSGGSMVVAESPEEVIKAIGRATA